MQDGQTDEEGSLQQTRWVILFHMSHECRSLATNTHSNTVHRVARSFKMGRQKKRARLATDVLRNLVPHVTTMPQSGDKDQEQHHSLCCPQLLGPQAVVGPFRGSSVGAFPN